MALAFASHARRLLLPGSGAPARLLHAQPYQARVGVAEFLNGVEKRTEKHAAKPKEAVRSDIQMLIEAGKLRRERKNLRAPCKCRKLIFSLAHKFRLGLWKPRAEPKKTE